MATQDNVLNDYRLGSSQPINQSPFILLWPVNRSKIPSVYIELLNKYGIDIITDIVQEKYDYSEGIARQANEKIPGGTYIGDEMLDSIGTPWSKCLKKCFTLG
jgi:hypothetical protein